MSDLLVSWARESGPGSGWGLVRGLAARLCGDAAHELTISHLCGRCGSSGHGQPYAVGPLDNPPHISLARAGGFIFAAVSDSGALGVDAEPAGAADFDGFADVALGDRDHAADATLTWVRKESLLKATGHGLAIDPRELQLSGTGEVLKWPALLPEPGRAWILDLSAPTGLIAAVAALAVERPILTVLPAGREG